MKFHKQGQKPQIEAGMLGVLRGLGALEARGSLGGSWWLGGLRVLWLRVTDLGLEAGGAEGR